MKDKRLLDDFLAGDEAALMALVEYYQKELYAFICRQVGNAADAADLTQKVFVNVFLKADQFNGDSSFKTWLYQIAVNQCKNHYRSQDRQRIDDVAIDDLSLQSTGSSSEDEVIIDEERRLLRESINRLPNKQQLTVRLRLYQECTFAEIAQIMSSSTGTAKAHYHQAVQSLRRMVKEVVYESNEL